MSGKIGLGNRIYRDLWRRDFTLEEIIDYEARVIVDI